MKRWKQQWKQNMKSYKTVFLKIQVTSAFCPRFQTEDPCDEGSITFVDPLLDIFIWH